MCVVWRWEWVELVGAHALEGVGVCGDCEGTCIGCEGVLCGSCEGGWARSLLWGHVW